MLKKRLTQRKRNRKQLLMIKVSTNIQTLIFQSNYTRHSKRNTSMQLYWIFQQ
jgi:hypothetical protein